MPISLPVSPRVSPPALTRSTEPQALSGASSPAPAVGVGPTRSVSGPADRFELAPTTMPRRDNTQAVVSAQTAGSPGRNGLEILLEMPDAQTVPVSVELRDLATRWWVPGAMLPDVLQRTGFFPRAFNHQLVPEQVGPNLYRVRLERGWYARLCGAELAPQPGVNVVKVVRTSDGTSSFANIGLAPDKNATRSTSSCALPAGASGSEFDPLSCTAPVASGGGASSTVRLDWPR